MAPLRSVPVGGVGVTPEVPAPPTVPDARTGGDAVVDPQRQPEPSVTGDIDPNSPPGMQVRESGQATATDGLRWTATGQPRVEITGPNPSAPDPSAWSDSTALRIVLADFDRAAAYRQSNHDTRWQEAAEAYLAFTRGQKFWEGTRVPRANIPVHLCFQQVEALIPQGVEALTGNDLDFDVEAQRAGTTISQCHLVRDVLQYQLRSLGGTHTRFLGWREVIRRMWKDGLIYGNGVAEWGWEGPYQVPVMRWERQQFPEMAPMMHPLLGPVMAPTGAMVQQNVPVRSSRTVSQLWIDPCALTDFYIDPSTRGPSAQEAEFAIRRKLMTVDELSRMRGTGDFRIPSDDDLIALARKKQWTQGDTTRQTMAAARGESAQPLEDTSRDPRLLRVEVLRYSQKHRHVWTLGRDWTAWNGENQYGAIPFSNWTYIDVPGAFYGMSIPDLCRGDQELARLLIEGRIDELNLILHPPFVARAGSFRTASQAKVSPGRVIETTGDPLKDLQRLEMGNVTQSAFVEVDSLENRVQKKTGVTDLAVLGTPTSGGNSANRTATGVQAQTNASNSRVHYLVANFEDQTAGPLLEIAWQLTRQFMDPQTLMEIVGPNGQILQVDPVDLLNADPRFVMKTAQRMKQRASLQAGGMNQISQFVMNPELIAKMEESGKTLDIDSFSELYCDVYNVRPWGIFRPMTPQEIAAKQQRDAQAGQEKLQLQAARMQVMGEQADARDETKIQIALLQALATAGLLPKVFGMPATVELEQKRLESDIAHAGE